MTKDWDTFKDLLVKLYIHDDLKLEDLRDYMSHHGFHASARAYRQRFKMWNVGKYHKRSNSQVYPVRQAQSSFCRRYHPPPIRNSRSNPDPDILYTIRHDYPLSPDPDHDRSPSLSQATIHFSVPHADTHRHASYSSPPSAMNTQVMGSRLPLNPSPSPTSQSTYSATPSLSMPPPALKLELERYHPNDLLGPTTAYTDSNSTTRYEYSSATSPYATLFSSPPTEYMYPRGVCNDSLRDGQPGPYLADPLSITYTRKLPFFVSDNVPLSQAEMSDSSLYSKSDSGTDAYTFEDVEFTSKIPWCEETKNNEYFNVIDLPGELYEFNYQEFENFEPYYQQDLEVNES